MGLRGLIKRLERSARGNIESFVLEDGSIHYFSPSGGELYRHACACVRAGYEGKPYPEAPATLQALCKARDRAAAVEKVATSRMFPYEREALVERGELVPRSLVAGRESGEQIGHPSES
jgi:hypothetical protein